MKVVVWKPTRMFLGRSSRTEEHLHNRTAWMPVAMIHSSQPSSQQVERVGCGKGPPPSRCPGEQVEPGYICLWYPSPRTSSKGEHLRTPERNLEVSSPVGDIP